MGLESGIGNMIFRTRAGDVNNNKGQVVLMSITTEPGGEFTKDSKYFNSTTRKIYTAVVDNSWENAVESVPEFNVIYVFDNDGTTEYYQWDGDNLIETDLEKYQLKSNITNSFNSSSQTTYPSSKALSEGLKSVKPNLFDIKVMSERIATKGWSCISYPAQNKLNKADVPTIYNYLKDKFDNVDGAISSLTNFNAYIDSYWVVNDYVLFRYNQHLYKCKISDFSSDTTKWQLVRQYTSDGVFGKNNIVFYDFNTQKLVILNYSTLEIIKLIDLNMSNKPFYFDGYFYYNKSDIQGYLFKFSDSNNPDDIIETSVAVGENITQIFSHKNGEYVVRVTRSAYNYPHYTYKTTDLSDYSQYVEITGTVLAYVNNGLIRGHDQNGFEVSYDNGTTWSTLSEIDFSIYGKAGNNSERLYNAVKPIQNGYIIYFDVSGLIALYTKDFISFTYLIKDVNLATTLIGSDGEFLVFTCYYNSDWTIFYSQPSLIKTIYTDIYTIDGSSVTVKYYKNGDWKICTPDIAVGNDTNLQTIFECLGYINYWWIDITNEKIVLPRDNRFWTMMYVGDDYKDSLLPSGEYSAVALKKDINEKEIVDTTKTSDSLTVQNNTKYVYSQPLTSLSIALTTVKKAQIYFTTDTATTLTLASGQKYIGSLVLADNTDYVLSINNGIIKVESINIVV